MRCDVRKCYVAALSRYFLHSRKLYGVQMCYGPSLFRIIIVSSKVSFKRARIAAQELNCSSKEKFKLGQYEFAT